jgi:endonuclease/exonuclease/phosphatase family metal-dependent hydrolase
MPFACGYVAGLRGVPRDFSGLQGEDAGEAYHFWTITSDLPRLAAALALLSLGAGLFSAAPAAARRSDGERLTVMTRNVYLGGDIARPATGRTGEEFERKAAALWQMVQRTNFPARAKLIAREIRQARPDLIGLQEVALWRRGPDGVKDGPATPATQVVYDYLGILLGELRAAGMHYRIGSWQEEADIEAPTSLGHDVRVTIRDVVLVRRRRDLRVRRPLSGTFAAAFALPTVVGAVTVRRGWAGLDFRLHGRQFRFINTHLEAFSNDVRVAQAGELIAPGGPARTGGSVIVVGDLNSDPTGASGSPPDAYRVLTGAELRDAWLQVRPANPGHECCFKREDITDAPPAPFDRRIDHILATTPLRATFASVIGDDPRNRTASRLWPSDHGGVVVALALNSLCPNTASQGHRNAQEGEMEPTG